MIKKHIQIHAINIVLLISIILSILSYTIYALIRSQKVSAVSGTLDVSTSSISNTGTLTGVKFSDRDNVPYYLDPARSLTTSLKAVWHLEEAGSTRADSYGTNNLTDNNTVTSATGKLNTAGQFTAANSEYLSIADNANLSMGTSTSFTVSAWVYMDSKPVAAFPVAKWTTNNYEYDIRYNGGATDRFAFEVSNNGTVPYIKTVTANNFGAPSLSTWYLIIAWYDLGSGKIYISVNNGTADELAASGAYNGTAAFEIGRAPSAYFWDGRIDEVAVWKRVLTASERTMLYNSGNGINLDASLTTSGNVGIGTTIPRNLLHVASTDTLTGKATLIVDQLENQDIMAASASGTNKFVILNNGNVGIGSTTPATALDVNGTINASVFGFDVETQTAECSGASCVATATCTAGYTYIVGFRATGSAACDTNPSACSAFCVGPGGASCTVTSTSNSVASVYIVCGKTN